MLMSFRTILYNKSIFETISVKSNNNRNGKSPKNKNNNVSKTIITASNIKNNVINTNEFQDYYDVKKLNNYYENVLIRPQISYIDIAPPSSSKESQNSLERAVVSTDIKINCNDCQSDLRIANYASKEVSKEFQQQKQQSTIYTNDISVNSIKKIIDEKVKKHTSEELFDCNRVMYLDIRDSTNVLIGNKMNIKLNLKAETWEGFSNAMDQHYSDVFYVIPRSAWKPLPIKEPYDLIPNPVKYVVILHSASESSFTVKGNLKLIRWMQRFHIKSRGWNDISYNFLIGLDGNIYEGRGWGVIGAHTKGFNNVSMGIAFIGCFLNERPTIKALRALQKLLDQGVRNGHLTEDYRLVLHSQFSDTLSPGQCVVEEIVKFDHFHKDPKSEFEDL